MGEQVNQTIESFDWGYAGVTKSEMRNGQKNPSGKVSDGKNKDTPFSGA